jgi:xenotropic and polytropic retrovirus receptor 1
MHKWRLAFAGIYAVEFRDFFLGDMFCSLTYSMQVCVPVISIYALKANQSRI